MMNKPLMVWTTVPGGKEADALSAHLIEARLAACVQVMPAMQSHYLWQGSVHHDSEILLIIKTVEPLFSNVEAAIRSMHPYEVPEIIGVPVTHISEDYRQWLEDCLN